MGSRLSRRVLSALLVVILAGAGVVGLIALLTSLDRSSLSPSTGPGRRQAGTGDLHLAPGSSDPAYAQDPPTSGPHVLVPVTHDGVHLSDDQLLSALELGNVVLVYADAGQTPALRTLAAAVAGPFAPSIASAGQSVILDPVRNARRGPVLALAWQHELRVASPRDPGLSTFASYWLGRGASSGG